MHSAEAVCPVEDRRNQGVTNGRQGFPTEQRQGTEAVKSAAYSRKSKKTLVAEAERAGSTKSNGSHRRPQKALMITPWRSPFFCFLFFLSKNNLEGWGGWGEGGLRETGHPHTYG